MANEFMMKLSGLKTQNLPIRQGLIELLTFFPVLKEIPNLLYQLQN